MVKNSMLDSPTPFDCIITLKRKQEKSVSEAVKTRNKVNLMNIR